MRKKFFAVIAVLLCSLFVLGGCSNTPEENREYKYQSASFVKDNNLTFQDVSRFAPPAAMGENIDSISALEKYILENIDEYSVIVMSESGMSKIYLKNEIDGITLKGDKITLSRSGESNDYSYTLEDNKYVLNGVNDDKCKILCFEKGKFYYSFELTEGFVLRYYFA